MSKSILPIFRRDSTSIMLTNYIHRGLSDKQRSIKISKCCKVIRDRTSDKEMYETCRTIISSNQNGDYKGVIQAANNIEILYKAIYP